MTELQEIARRWIGTGRISDQEKQLLKAQYLLEIDADPPCKTCETFWLGLKTHFYTQLKQLNALPVKQAIRKFLIIGGWLQLPGSPVLVVNEGTESEDRTILTDEMAIGILAQYPSYEGTLIGINPAWQEANPAEESTGEESEEGDSTEGEDESNDTVTKAQLKAQFDTLQAEHDELKAAHTSLQTDHDKAVLEVDRLRGELSGTKGQLTATKNKLDKANGELTALKNSIPAETVQQANPDGSLPATPQA